jgi:hypothetical protein
MGVDWLSGGGILPQKSKFKNLSIDEMIALSKLIFGI